MACKLNMNYLKLNMNYLKLNMNYGFLRSVLLCIPSIESRHYPCKIDLFVNMIIVNQPFKNFLQRID